jgi:hypothetical protein
MNENTPLVRLCSYCQKEFGLEASMTTSAKAGVRFTHGFCLRHFEGQLKNAGTPEEEIKVMMDKFKNQAPPDLAEHPDLVEMYKKGIWLPQQLQQSKLQQAAESINESIDLKARWKKLAGIKS